MDTTILNRFQWYRSLTLNERLDAKSNLANWPNAIQANEKLAQHRIKRWKSLPPFANHPEYFLERLRGEGIEETEFLKLLGESPEVAQKNLIPPPWLEDFLTVMGSEGDDFQGESGQFLDIVQPLVQKARKSVYNKAKSLASRSATIIFEPEAIEEMLYVNLRQQLNGILARTLVLELNIARLQGILKGNDTATRFQDFCQKLQQPDFALPLLQEYPVLMHQVHIRINNWVSNCLEFLTRLCADWNLIRSNFSPDNSLGLLSNIEMGVGDRHRNGRSVTILSFDSGTRLVYKPRSLSVDIHFQELLDWVNKRLRDEQLEFRTLKAINQNTHGWIEFVEACGCQTTEEIQRFYKKVGGLLALLYIIRAEDFHHENLIASGEFPVLIDLESLFGPHFYEEDIQEFKWLAMDAWANSVLRVGLLPHLLWSNKESEGVDISGLGSTKGQLTPFPIPFWEKGETDEMYLTRKRVELIVNQHRPTICGDEINPLDFLDEIIDGFSKLYQLLLQNKSEFANQNGLIGKFANDEVRIILRPTMTYVRILQESLHPDMFRDALDREQLFDWLWINVDNKPLLKKVIAAERKDLWEGDVPIFTTRPNSCNIWTSQNICISNFFSKSGMDAVQERCKNLTAKDLEQQLWFIRASFNILADSTQQKRENRRKSNKVINASQASLLHYAKKIAEYLSVSAFVDEHGASWIGLAPSKTEKTWSLLPSGITLYSGLPGITLFLAYLGNLTADTKSTHLARKSLTTLINLIEVNKEQTTHIGAFEGMGGIVYTLTHLHALWDDSPFLLDKIDEVVRIISKCVEQDRSYDIIRGAAGCICSLIASHQYRPNQDILNVAIRCGELLLECTSEVPVGVGWIPENTLTIKKPLTGFSHGAAGIAFALLKLASVSKQDRFRKVALEAITYERSHFSPVEKNWPDLREQKLLGRNLKQDERTYATVWCHGAPGIGLARLLSLDYLDDVKIRTEIYDALETTLESGFNLNHCLCHGDLGNLELLIQARQKLGEPKWDSMISRISSEILTSIENNGWLCGNPLQVEEPGLMTGLSGIGYGLLRLAFPAKVPSILGLASPVSC